MEAALDLSGKSPNRGKTPIPLLETEQTSKRKEDCIGENKRRSPSALNHKEAIDFPDGTARVMELIYP